LKTGIRADHETTELAASSRPDRLLVSQSVLETDN
jgi:hypothetical protein